MRHRVGYQICSGTFPSFLSLFHLFSRRKRSSESIALASTRLDQLRSHLESTDQTTPSSVPATSLPHSDSPDQRQTDMSTAATAHPKITVHWLEHSRAQRILWLLEEVSELPPGRHLRISRSALVLTDPRSGLVSVSSNYPMSVRRVPIRAPLSACSDRRHFPHGPKAAPCTVETDVQRIFGMTVKTYKRDPKTMLAPKELAEVHPLGKVRPSSSRLFVLHPSDSHPLVSLSSPTATVTCDHRRRRELERFRTPRGRRIWRDLRVLDRAIRPEARISR